MTNLPRAVRKTIAYSAFFNCPLTHKEIHHWLISSRPVSLSAIVPLLPAKFSPRSKKTSAQNKLKKAQKMASFLSILPTIQMIAVTGSVAVGSAKHTDDIDLMVVTADHTLWLTRPFVLLLLSLFSRRRLPGQSHAEAAHSFCPNLWLEHRSLAVPLVKRNLYTAHEVLFVTPVFDRFQTHSLFLSQNSWVKKYLANAYLSVQPQAIRSPSYFSTLFILLFPFNLLAFFLQYLYMLPRRTNETVTLHCAYFHTQDFAGKIKHYLSSI